MRLPAPPRWRQNAIDASTTPFPTQQLFILGTSPLLKIPRFRHCRSPMALVVFLRHARDNSPKSIREASID